MHSQWQEFTDTLLARPERLHYFKVDYCLFIHYLMLECFCPLHGYYDRCDISLEIFINICYYKFMKVRWMIKSYDASFDLSYQSGMDAKKAFMSTVIKEVYPSREPFGLHFRRILPKQLHIGKSTSK